LDERCLAEFNLSSAGADRHYRDGALLQTWLKENFTSKDANVIFNLINQNPEGFCAVINIPKGVSLRPISYKIIIHHRHAWLHTARKYPRDKWSVKDDEKEGEFVLYERGKPAVVFKSQQ